MFGHSDILWVVILMNYKQIISWSFLASRWCYTEYDRYDSSKGTKWEYCSPPGQVVDTPITITIIVLFITSTIIIRQGSRMRLGVTAKVRRIWKWSNGVKISEMGIFCCISITNNVNSCKKFNEKAQMANFSVLAKGRRPRQELFAKKHGKLGKLKRKLLKILKRYVLSRIVPW